MRSITTGIAMVILALGLNAFAPLGGLATTDGTRPGILGFGSDVIQQSAPACTRVPPPSQC